jgi:Uma2 family endonuclease
MLLSCSTLLVDRQALSEHTTTSSSTKSLGQALRVSLVKPGAYLSESYYMWEFGKPPDVVIEIVSNTKGEEKGTKRIDYAQIGVAYYIVYDPLPYLDGDVLEVYELRGGQYQRLPDPWLPNVGIGVILWEGTFEGLHGTWLRWCSQDGVVIPTGAERIDYELQRAEAEHQRAVILAEKLRELGIDPDRL